MSLLPRPLISTVVPTARSRPPVLPVPAVLILIRAEPPPARICKSARTDSAKLPIPTCPGYVMTEESPLH